MGRIVDLCGEIAAAAEEGPEGLILPPEDAARLRDEWSDEDIDDALSLVHESLVQGELVEAADSLSSRLLEVLGAFGGASAFKTVETDGARVPLEAVNALTRRLARLEVVLDSFREGARPDRSGFEELRRRLADVGIEDEMESEPHEDPEDE